MKRNAKANEKLKLSRQTLRRLEGHQLGQVVGGTTILTCPPCIPTLELFVVETKE